jgi:hypothetical protein
VSVSALGDSLDGMRWLVGVIACVGCLALLVWTTLLRGSSGAFPNLVDGVFVGTFGVEGGSTVYPWSIVKDSNSHTLAVFVGDVRIPAQRVDARDPSGKTRLPLIVGTTEIRLRFTGREIAPGEYGGELINPISSEQGRWTLRRVPSDPITTSLEDDLTRWYALWQELDGLESEIAKAQAKADQSRSAVDNLHRYVSDEDALKKTANERLGRADSEIESARSNLAAQRQSLDQKIRDLELSQRVSPEGALVFLSRETIQRESRWIELTLKMLSPESSPGFQQALEKVRRIKNLKDQIAEERDKVMKGGGEDTKRTLKRETESEEEFYGQLQ